MFTISSPHILIKLYLSKKLSENRQLIDKEFFEKQMVLEGKKIKSGISGKRLPSNVFNILDYIQAPKTSVENNDILLEILNEDKDRLGEQIQSKSLDINNYNLAKNELNEIIGLVDLVENKRNKITTDSEFHLQNRSFLPLYLQTYKSYLKYSENQEYFSFLNSATTTKDEPINRVLLNELEYQDFEILLRSTDSLSNFLELIESFTKGIFDKTKIALFSFEYALSGYYLYFSPTNTVLLNSLLELCTAHPEYISYPDDTIGYFVFSTETPIAYISKALSSFDLWVDVYSGVFFQTLYKDTEYSLDQATPPLNLDVNYFNGLLFDYSMDAAQIRSSAIIESLEKDFEYTKNKGKLEIQIYANGEFIKPVNNITWTYLDIALILIIPQEETPFNYFGLFCTKSQSIIFLTHDYGHIKDKLLLLFSNTIDLLKTNSIEQVNPDLILSIAD